MANFLTNKHILLGVTGGIAAYKSADLVRRLRERGAVVRVVMTENAKRFITPLTMQAVSGYPVHDDLFDLQAEAAMGHIELARWADAIMIAPATADCISKLIHGEADDLLTTVCLAARVPLVLAPAMNQGMWNHIQTRENVQALRAKGTHILGPGEGSQACGDVGMGRMLDPTEIVEGLSAIFANGLLAGKRVLITAGPTREAIDAIRFITNASSGKMGYALAEAAQEAGAQVTLISGPVSLSKPARIRCIDVVSAEEMLQAVLLHLKECDIFIGTAAVADFRCKTINANKIPKQKMPKELALEPTSDIIAQVAASVPRPFVVGFAAQTDQLIEKAQAKLKEKKLDMIVANLVDQSGMGLGSDDNEVTVLSAEKPQHLAKMSKPKLARELIKMIAEKSK